MYFLIALEEIGKVRSNPFLLGMNDMTMLTAKSVPHGSISTMLGYLMMRGQPKLVHYLRANNIEHAWNFEAPVAWSPQISEDDSGTKQMVHVALLIKSIESG